MVDDRDWERDMRPFEIRRGMIVHEDQLIGTRLGLLVGTQGLPLTPSAILLSSPGLSTVVVALLVAGFSLIGILAARFLAAGLRGAELEQEAIRGEREQLGRHSLAFPFSDGREKELIAVLQATGLSSLVLTRFPRPRRLA